MIVKIVIITLFCCGLKKLTEFDMLLYPVKQWMIRVVKNKQILKPTIDCIYCFASFWGTIIYWSITLFIYGQPVSGETLIAWPIVCVSCEFTNGLAYGILAKYENYLQ